MKKDTKKKNNEPKDAKDGISAVSETNPAEPSSWIDSVQAEKKRKTGLQDYFEHWRDCPALDIRNELLTNMFKDFANKKINSCGQKLHTQDTVKRSNYAVLELCAEKYFLEMIIERNRTKIKQLEEKQKKMNEELREMLKRMEDFALKAHIEK